MLIDWFTVIAQAVNFLILVWLMKRFLYQPILKALDAREKRIAAELEDANKKESEATAEREEFKRKNNEFEKQRAAMLNKATDEAATERQRLFEQARKDAENLRTKQQEMLSSEYQNLHDEIARRTQAEVFALTRKTLEDLAGTTLEARMVEVFISRLYDLNSEEKRRLAAMLKSVAIPVQVHSAFELTVEQRAMIESEFKEIFATDTQVSFDVVSGLLSGIELIMQGQKIAWSISGYIATLEKEVNELLKAKSL